MERTPPRNISVTAVVDKTRHDMLEELARSLGVTKSLAVTHLIDLHAGVALAELATMPVPRFEPSKAKVSTLSLEVVADVAGAVRHGATKADAYRLAGVHERTAARWEKKGKEDRETEKRSLYADLSASLDRARAEFNHELIQEARRKGDYKTLLKLLDPEQFNPVSRQSVDVTHKFQLVIDWDRLGIEEARTLAGLLRKASPLEDDRAVTRTARPALEAIPADVAELVDAEDGDWSEAPVLEAPALDAQKPDH